jgi:chloramphenicol 3-O phosphotransferase
MPLPDVIFLNGSSSAGKTSLAKALQARLAEPYLHFGVDDLFPWLPPQWNGTPEGFQLIPLSSGEMPITVGEGGRRVMRAWRRMLRSAADEGLKFILDEVMITEGALDEWIEALDGLDVFFVGVRCELAELQRREAARGDRGVGQALWQHERVHVHGPYDLEVDTTGASAEACAEAIITALAHRQRPSAFERLVQAAAQ